MGVRCHAAIAAALLILLAACASASASVACPSDLVVPSAATASIAATSVVCDLNVIRSEHGLRPLRWDWRLWAAAQRQAQDMSAREYLSHVTPEGRNLADRVQPTGYLPSSPTWLLAENVGWGTGALSTPLAIAFGWMDSEAHRRNVLDPTLEDVGIGIVAGGPNGKGMVYVADFGKRGVVPVIARTRTRAPRGRHH